jgi:hypothetical protein
MSADVEFEKLEAGGRRVVIRAGNIFITFGFNEKGGIKPFARAKNAQQDNGDLYVSDELYLKAVRMAAAILRTKQVRVPIPSS